jgi:ribosome-binding factor A
MRHTPTLEFVHDALPESAAHIDELLAKARASDAELAAAAAGAQYAGDADPYRKDDQDADLDEPGEDIRS